MAIEKITNSTVLGEWPTIINAINDATVTNAESIVNSIGSVYSFNQKIDTDGVDPDNSESFDDALNRFLEANPTVVFKKNDGIYHELSEGGKNLSGGQKQRLGIARAIVNKPHILVMDDATSALDAITEKKVNDNISNFDWDLAIVIISQKIKSVIKCDEILVLDEGRIIGKGTHNELLSTCNLYRELFELQHPEASDNLGGAHE